MYIANLHWPGLTSPWQWARFIKHLHPFYTHILILQAFPTISTEEVRFINVILTVDYSGDPSANTEKNMKKIKSFEIYTVFSHFIYTIFTIWLMNRAHCVYFHLAEHTAFQFQTCFSDMMRCKSAERPILTRNSVIAALDSLTSVLAEKGLELCSVAMCQCRRCTSFQS